MRDDGLATRVALGAAAGMVGTMVIFNLRIASQKWLPSTMEPGTQDPGEWVVEQAERALPEGVRERIPDAVEGAAAGGAHFGYGMTFGALYGALGDSGHPLADGIGFGLGTWAAGHLGWLPALGLKPPVTEFETEQLAGNLARHALYGIATVAAYRQLRRWSE